MATQRMDQRSEVVHFLTVVRLRDRSSNPDKVKNFHFSMSSSKPEGRGFKTRRGE
jgi:hypothetical protein